jgi:hypothetical protein
MTTDARAGGLRGWIRAHRIELKYLLIGAMVTGVLLALDRADVLSGLDKSVVDVLDASKGLGVIGMFFVALISNCAVFVQIPYTLPLLSAAIGGASLGEMMALGVAAGVGAGFGEIIKYHVADRVLGKNPDLHRSRLYQWVLRQAAEKPRHVKWIVFIWAASVIPDDTVIIPLAMIRYGTRRILVPLFTGKVAHNLFFAGLFYAISDTAEDFVKGGLRVDLAFALIVAFFLVIFYQVEKSRQHETPDAEPAADDAAVVADTADPAV